jgi:hypothetical protein
VIGTEIVSNVKIEVKIKNPIAHLVDEPFGDIAQFSALPIAPTPLNSRNWAY